MKLRAVVIAAFVLALAAPGLIAYATGVLPGPSPASADATANGPPGVEFRAASLVWPDEALGLTATDAQVVWEQRDRRKSIAGLWAYDVATGRQDRLLGPSSAGRGTGFPAASREKIVWAAWPGRRGEGSPRIQGYNQTTTRRWTVAEAGRDPAISGNAIVWVERGADAAAADDVLIGVHDVTDETFSVPVAGRVRDLAASGLWVAWIAGRGKTAAVWTRSNRDGEQRLLAKAGTSVAIDRRRVAWSTLTGRGSTAIAAWDRDAKKTGVLCRAPGAPSSLALGRGVAVWVSTDASGDGDIWAYDFARDEAYAVCDHDARQASPVVVGDTVFWADQRSDGWELYGRDLKP